MVAKVLVDVMSKSVNRLFDYQVPDNFTQLLEVGMRVKVEFGHRTVMGFVLEIIEDNQTSEQTLKPIIAILDLEPMLTLELINLAYELENSTSSVLLKIIETMIPAALKVVYKTMIEVVENQYFSDDLKSIIKNSTYFEFNEQFYPFAKEIKILIKKGYLKQNYQIISKSNILTKKYVSLMNKDVVCKNVKQAEVISYLAQHNDKEVLFKEVLTELNITSSILKTLEKYQAIKIFEKEEYREIYEIDTPIEKAISLNTEQSIAYQNVIDALNQEKIFLLHGVTGSGKTEIYLKVIEQVINSGKEALFLVPEISLTPMMLKRFNAHFKGQVAVLHSGLSIGEKYDEWRKIIRKNVKVVIGARSACFAPLTNIGVMIVDEAHETTYKQDEMPSYYAIDVLEKRAKTFNCPLILGSATPNIESYARYKRGYYELLKLEHKALNSFIPDIEIIDMKQEFKKGITGLFSERLIDEIKIRMDKKEQVILLLNRRGYSSFVMCRNCGHVFRCPNCDISLVYHENDHTIKCHYCGHKQDTPKKCDKCESEDLIYLGSGTQKVEQELANLFPNARVIRMDNDTTRTKNAHQILLHEFEYEGDILLGTQMIAKGLDFPKVTLVGIIQADGNLYSPDFRAPEKTFQLIMQVSGRSGRGDLKGKVIVQAFNPEHYAIRYAIRNEYIPFYEYEMKLRKISRYSPFYFINKILLQGENVRDIFIAGHEITKELRRLLSVEAIILGPTLPVISRVKGKYRCEIILKYRKEPNVVMALQAIKQNYENEHIYVAVDMFPFI